MTSTTTAASNSGQQNTTPTSFGPLSVQNSPYQKGPLSSSSNSNNGTSSLTNANSTSPRTSTVATAAAMITKKGSPPSSTMLQVPPRKRSKVSRACDECRRKKIRCDAGAEEDPQCTSCRRAGEKCSFSRIPMKRGPSKRLRWDKERSPSDDKKIQGTNEFVLTQAAPIHGASGGYNRLPSIDTLTSPQVETSPKSQWVAPPPPPPPPPQQANGHSPHHHQQYQHSPQGGNGFNGTPTTSHASHHPQFGAHHPPPPPPPPPPHHHSHSHSLSSSSPATVQTPQNREQSPQRPFGRNSFSYHRHTSVSSDSSNSEIKRYSEPDEPGWDDRCIDSYYQVVHPALPILPSSKVRLRSRLLSCSSPALRYTLLCGVNGLVRRENSSEYKAQILQGIMQVSGGSLSSLNTQSKILYLTTLILLFLQTGESPWLGSAISLAYDMQLHLNNDTTSSSVAGDRSPHGTNYQAQHPDSEDDSGLSRRLFLILVILDRLHSVVKQVPIQIPDDVIHLNPETDNIYIGATGVQVIRLCMILGHGSKYQESSPSILFQELEQAYQSIESMWDTTPILKAMYYLVLVRFDWISIQKCTEKKQLNVLLSNALNDTSVLTTLLESPLISVSPLIGYFIPPLVSTLVDLVRVLSDSDSDSDSGSDTNSGRVVKHQFWSQMEFLDGMIQRRFPEFDSLRRDISQARSYGSPRSKLEGLAAVAHAHQQAGLQI